MGKLNLLIGIFQAVELIAFIPLTIEIFTDMNTDIIIASAVAFGIGLIGSCVCVIVKTIKKANNIM